MALFVKLFVTSIFLPLCIYASTYNVEEIRADFHDKVVLEPLYAQLYKKSLNSACPSNTKECFRAELATLMKNSSAQKSLQHRAIKFSLDEKYWSLAQKRLQDKREHFSHSQFIALVDLSKQVLIIVLWDKEAEIFYPIGFDFISSGNIEREVKVTTGEDHYLKTPSGLFSIESGWRSKGEVYDDNVTMPYGQKDSFVFYFGMQKSVRYNTFDANGTKITDKNKWQLITDELELAIHAHKSAAPFGEPNSHGCIRMSNELNLFIDNNLVFFRHLYNEDKKWIHPYKKPPKEPKNHELAGKYILIIDKL